MTKIRNVFLYRRGNGNDGDFPRTLVKLNNKDNAYVAIRALVANEFIAGSATRRFILENIIVTGEVEYAVHAMVDEGPNGENAFGASWLTASLEPVTNQSDLDYYAVQYGKFEVGKDEIDPKTGKTIVTKGKYRPYRIRELLDISAIRTLRKGNKKG